MRLRPGFLPKGLWSQPSQAHDSQGLTSQECGEPHRGSLKLMMVRVFIPRQLAATTNQGSSPPPELTVKHLSARHFLWPSTLSLWDPSEGPSREFPASLEGKSLSPGLTVPQTERLRKMCCPQTFTVVVPRFKPCGVMV